MTRKVSDPVKAVYEREIARLKRQLNNEQRLRARGMLNLMPEPAEPAPAASERGRAELEIDLEESREAVAALMLRSIKERRRLKAVLQSVRQRLRKVSPKLSERLAGAEKDLEASRETQASLLVELTRVKRDLAASKPAEPAPEASERARAELESDLDESRETVAALMQRAAKESRRMKAVLLVVRKRLRKAGPKLSGSRLAEAEKDLEASREAQANLLVELTRVKRDARAKDLSSSRPARAAKAPVDATSEGFLAIAREAYGAALTNRLERLGRGRVAADIPLANDALRLARGLRLASEASATLPGRADPAMLLEGRLETWGAAFTTRGSSIECSVKSASRKAMVAPSAFRLLLDELLANAAERLPRGAELNVAAGPTADGGYTIAFSDDGPGLPAGWLSAPFPREPRSINERPGLGLTMAREVLRRWGGDLAIDSEPSVKGARLTVRLAASRP